MSYLVLARKYRPTGFSSVSGQEHVTRTLANAIRRDRVVHAYLFTGPRGVGKTSVARILSKALNCQQGLTPEPCLECPSCKEINQGSSIAVREIDGASHNSVDNVRELMDSFKSLPPPGYRYKVYIIDEVHMLSISAFNALLKSLEEPPPNTVFILATTEIHKIPDTVISRCQRHDFRALSVSVIEARLREVIAYEHLEAEPEAIRLIARLAEGSMRDAQTLLDRVQSFCQGPLTAQETSLALGTIERRALSELSGAIFSRDTAQVLQRVSDIFSTGTDPATVLREFVNFWRELFVAKLSGESGLRLLGVNDDSIVDLLRLVASVESIDLQDLWDLAREGADKCMRSAHPRYGFEALAVRLATRQPVVEMAALIQEGMRGAPSIQVARLPEAQKPLIPAVQQISGAAAEVAPSTSTVMSANSGGAEHLKWEDLVAFAAISVSKVLVENLRRLRIQRFENGVIEATGPDLSVSMLSKEKEKVIGVLQQFAESKGFPTVKVWKFSLSKGVSASESASESSAKKASESKELEAHPAVQSLQKVFPGSKVEQVRVKN